MKKIHRFLIESPVRGKTATLTQERLVFQIGTVLKLKPNEEIILFTDGGDDVLYRITAVSKHRVEVEHSAIIAGTRTATPEMTALVSIVKGDLFESIVQKLTEIGVASIIPILTDRTVKQSVRRQRLQTISDEALELCGGNRRVRIADPMPLRTAIERFAQNGVVFDQEGVPLEHARLEKTYAFFIGPEGGWSDDEKTLFAIKNLRGAKLAPRTLRAETAAIVGAYTLLWNSSH